jgi:group I intron endonuclease
MGPREFRYFIYKITCLLDGRIYVGKTRQSVAKRWEGHIDASQNKNAKMYISRAIQKYGEENFKIEQIEECKNAKEMKERESYYILLLNSYKKGIGFNCKTESDEGFEVLPEESRLKRSISIRKRKRIRKINYGINVTKDRGKFLVTSSYGGIKYYYTTDSNEEAKIMADKISSYFFGKDIPLNFEDSKNYTNEELKNAFDKFRVGKRKTEKSKFRGVSWECNHWAAKLKFSHSSWFLGFYNKEDDAALAVDKARFIFKGLNSVYYNFSDKINNYNIEEIKNWFDEIAKKRTPTVSWIQREGRYKVCVTVDNKLVIVGLFDTIEEALEANDMATLYFKLDREIYYSDKIDIYKNKMDSFFKEVYKRKERYDYHGIVRRNRYNSIRYHVLIDHEGKRYNLGSYATEIDAARAYDFHVRKMNLILVKSLNFPNEIIDHLPDKQVTKGGPKKGVKIIETGETFVSARELLNKKNLNLSESFLSYLIRNKKSYNGMTFERTGN